MILKFITKSGNSQQIIGKIELPIFEINEEIIIERSNREDTYPDINWSVINRFNTEPNTITTSSIPDIRETVYIKITGNFNRYGFNSFPNFEGRSVGILSEVLDFGNNGITNFSGAFRNAKALTSIPNN